MFNLIKGSPEEQNALVNTNIILFEDRRVQARFSVSYQTSLRLIRYE